MISPMRGIGRVLTHGSRPVRASYAVAARANWSAAPVTGAPEICSGERYDGVPTTVPGWVSCVSPPLTSGRSARGIRLAMPKSSTTARPSSRTMTLSGFTSRWITPRWCALPRARADSTSTCTSWPRASVSASM